jgi:hypothetical protein
MAMMVVATSSMPKMTLGTLEFHRSRPPMVLDVKLHWWLTLMIGEGMATIGELAATMAQAEGLDPSAVALIARYIREAGFIQKKGRGPAAAQMVVSDAANLLIAVNASTMAAEAHEVVPVYRELPAYEWDVKKQRLSKVNGTFGEALELLIKAAMTGKLPDTFLSKTVHRALRDAFERGKAEISIHFDRPNPRASITIQPAVPKLSGNPADIIPQGYFSLSFAGHSGQEPKRVSDRKDHTEIGHVTVFSIAKLLQRSGRKDSISASEN